MKTKRILLMIFLSQLVACASGNIAQNLSVVSFDDKATAESLHSIGNINGKDCTWYVLGYSIGEAPSVRNAFLNAMDQREGSLIPGQKATVKGAPLKAVKNVTVEGGGFNAYIASRSCVIVTGVGLQ